jgi:hypothetical protein
MPREYKLLRSNNPDVLAQDVMEALEEEWQLWGNPFVALGLSQFGKFYQAMYRHLEDKPAEIQIAAVRKEDKAVGIPA